MTRLILAAAAASALTIGCVGEFTSKSNNDVPLPGVDGGGGIAEVFFNNNVAPKVAATCGTAGACHYVTAPAFIQLNAPYSRIMQFRELLFPGFTPAAARLLLNGNGHQGAVWAQLDKDAIEDWLSLERQNGSSQSAPSAFAGCMSLKHWDAAGVALAWANKQTDRGPCSACHSLGEAKFYASPDSAAMLAAYRDDPAVRDKLFTVNATATGMVPNAALIEAVGARQPPYQTHPGFTYEAADSARLATERFYRQTQARHDAGLCAAQR